MEPAIGQYAKSAGAGGSSGGGGGEGPPKIRHLAERLLMTPAEWIAVETNPIQRDTERRARRSAHYLGKPHATHENVSMARLPGGETYKLDGHARAYNWSNGTPPGPPIVYVTVYECSTIEEVKRLYSTFDSVNAVEVVVDKLHGAMRLSGISFESELMKSRQFAGMMRAASTFLVGGYQAGRLDVYQLVSHWLPELVLLDQCFPSRRRFITGIGAAALLTFRRYGAAAQPFWEAYARDAGIKDAAGSDAVLALSDRIPIIRKKYRTLTGWPNIAMTVRTALTAYETNRSSPDYRYARQGSGVRGGAGVRAMKVEVLDQWLVGVRKISGVTAPRVQARAKVEA
jgi:hypothetical protein